MKSKAKNILIVGAGAVGLEVARQLRDRGEQVRIVDQSSGGIEKARLLGFDVHQVNLQHDEELIQLGIGSTVDVLFALLENDASNVFLVISVRAIAPQMPVISISEAEETVQRLHAAGATKVIDPYQISGYKIYELMRRPMISEILEGTVFGDVDLDIAEFAVTRGSFLDGLYLDRVALAENYDVIVVGVVDREFGDHLIFATDPKRHRIDDGDILVAIGPQEALARLKEDLSSGKVPREGS